MQFKNPDLLYALFLLLIPILVHLFQLRRFKKTQFSNVAFLKKVTQNTRKSSQIKKWLILCTRLLALAALVIAFAQPYLPQAINATQERETVIYLDNSFSMQAKGNKGPLLIQSIQEIISNISPSDNFTLVTQDKVFRDLNTERDRNTLLDISYSTSQLDPEAIYLKCMNAFSSNASTLKQFIAISDFQDDGWQNNNALNNIEQHWVKLEPVNYSNISIDSLSLDRTASNYEISVYLTSLEQNAATVPIALYNNDKLISKAAADFKENTTAKTTFSVPQDQAFAGKLTITDPDLLFDNNFYFNIAEPQAIPVLSINNSDDAFLEKLYPEPEFQYEKTDFKELDYSIIPDYKVIILNEINTVPSALVNALQVVTNNGGSIILIPDITAKPENYNLILGAYGLSPYKTQSPDKKLVTSINFDHPVYDDVFEKRVDNFQYPSVSNSFVFDANDKLLSLEDGNAFLAQNNALFAFASALNEDNSNFKNSPLIVPTFYNIARQAVRLPKIYYTLGSTTKFDIINESTGDATLALRKDRLEFIPMQEKQGDKITLDPQAGLQTDGIYDILFKDNVLGNVAYNYNRKESHIAPVSLNVPDTVAKYDSIADVFTELQQATNLNLIYKWFVIFALVFLLLEMLILKYFK